MIGWADEPLWLDLALVVLTALMAAFLVVLVATGERWVRPMRLRAIVGAEAAFLVALLTPVLYFNKGA